MHVDILPYSAVVKVSAQCGGFITLTRAVKRLSGCRSAGIHYVPLPKNSRPSSTPALKVDDDFRGWCNRLAFEECRPANK